MSPLDDCFSVFELIQCADSLPRRWCLLYVQPSETGWHSFRRTLATLLQSSGASVKTTQELLRHASPVMTMGTYAKAVTADKRQAQDAIVALFVTKFKDLPTP